MARIVLIFEDDGVDLVFRIEGTGVHEQPEKLAERTLRFVEQMISEMPDSTYH